jgi:hypothetical protein
MSQNRVSPYAQESPRPRMPRPAPVRPAPRGTVGPGTGPGAGSGAGSGVGPLTGLGVAIVLLAACVFGALLDLLLVGGPAWALVSLYIAACGYTASRVRGADWFAALVTPPLAFGVALILLAKLMPDSFGSGLLGVAATTFELLAAKAKALYCGAALSAVILATRRMRKPRRR